MAKVCSNVVSRTANDGGDEERNTRDKLVVEVKIRPTDIDVVRPGLEAVRFVAYKQWMTPVVQGMVTRVSADAVTDERTGAAYFLATVEVNSNDLSRVPEVKLQPSVPVEAAIITGRRTRLAFLLQPITDSFARKGTAAGVGSLSGKPKRVTENALTGNYQIIKGQYI